MKKCSPSLPLKEMQIKTTIRFYLIPVRTAIIKNTNNNNIGEDIGKKYPLYCWWECKISTITIENSMEATQKTKTRTAT
jgi:hypothetical protein